MTARVKPDDLEAKSLGRLPESAALAPPVVKSRRSGRWVLVTGLLLLALAAASAAAWWSFSAGASVHYATAPVTRGVVTRTVWATGRSIRAHDHRRELCVRRHPVALLRLQHGSEEGRLIDPRPYQSLVDQAKANLAVAKAQLVKDKARLAYAKTTVRARAGSLQRAMRSRRTPSTSATSTSTRRGADHRMTKPRSSNARPRSSSPGQSRLHQHYFARSTAPSFRATSTIGQTVAASFQTPTLFLIATDLDQDAGRHQCQRKRHRRPQGGRPGDVHACDAFPKRTFEGAVTPAAAVAADLQNVVTSMWSLASTTTTSHSSRA